MTWLALLLCGTVSFLFSGTEAGVLSVNRVRLRHQLKLNDPAARKLHRLLAQPERALITILLVTNFTNICIILMVTRLCVGAWGAWGYAAGVAICLPVCQFCLELLPKSLFRRFPYRSLAAISELLHAADWLLSPFLAAGHWILRLLPRRAPEARKLFAAREDFKYLTLESERQGALSPLERQVIQNILDLRSVRARDAMVAIGQVRSLPVSATVQELLETARATGLERFPLRDAAGHLTALVNVFEVLMDGAAKSLAASYQRRIVTVTPEEEAYSIMKKMRAARVTLAVVRTGDENVGLVAFEDLAGKLVKVGSEEKMKKNEEKT